MVENKFLKLLRKLDDGEESPAKPGADQTIPPAGTDSRTLLPTGTGSRTLLPTGTGSRTLLPTGTDSRTLLQEAAATKGGATGTTVLRAPGMVATDDRAVPAASPSQTPGTIQTLQKDFAPPDIPPIVASRSARAGNAVVEISTKGRFQARELISLQCRIWNPLDEPWSDLSLKLSLSAGFQYVRESTLLGNERVGDHDGISPLLGSSGLKLRPLSPGEALVALLQVEIEPHLEDGTPLSAQAHLLLNGEPAGDAEGELLVMAPPAFTRRSCRIEVNARDKVVPNQELLIRYFLENTGRGPATRVILRGVLPQLCAYLRQSTAIDGVSLFDQGDLSPLFSERGLYLGTLPPKDRREVTCRVKVHFPLEAGVKLAARGEVVADQTGSVELDPVEFVTEAHPDFSIPSRNRFESDRKSPERPGEQGLVEPGEVITLRLRYYNSGDAHAHNVLLEVTPPPNTTYARGSTRWQGTPLADVGPASPLFPTASGGGVNVGTVPVGEGGEVSVDLRVNSPLENNLILDTEASLKSDETPRRELGRLSFRVRSLPDFSDPVVNRIDVEPRGDVEPGDTLTYTLYLKNLGRTHANNVVIRSRVPTATTYLPGSLYWNGKKVDDTDGLSPLFTTHGFKIPQVKVEELHTFSFQVKVNDGLENGMIVETGAGIHADAVDPVLTLPVTSLVKSVADFTDPKTNFVETQPQGAATPGDLVTYFIHFKNVGKVTARRLVIRGTIPSHTTSLPNKTKLNGFPVADLDKVSPLFAPDGLLLGDSRAGERGTVSVQVRLASPLEKGTVLTGSFQIVSDDSEAVALAVPELSVRSMPDFSAASSNFLEVYPEEEVAPGELLTYVLHYRNSGNDDAQDVSLRLKLPEFTGYEKGTTKLNGLLVSDRDERSPLAMDGGLRVGTVPARAMGNVAFQVRVRPDVPHGTIITAGGTIDCKGLPPYATNIIQNKVCTVADFGDLARNRIECFPGEVLYPGDMVTYTLHYFNAGRMPAREVRLKLHLPPQVTYLPNSTTVNGLPAPDREGKSPLIREEGFMLGEVAPGRAPGGSGAVSLKAQVQFPLANGTLIVVKGGIYSDGGQVIPLPPVKAQVSSAPRFDEKHANFVEAVQGGRSSRSKLTYVANFKNTGNAVAGGVMLRGILDPRVEYVSGTTRVNGVPVDDRAGECPCFTQEGLPVGAVAPGEEGNVAFEVTHDETLAAVPYPVLALSCSSDGKEWTLEG